MRAAILHLSDLHLASRDADLFGRAENIASAAAPRLHDAEACLVVVSGDLAYSGTEEQYYVFGEFWERLEKSLASKGRFGEDQLDLVLVPGNHDCDFSNEGDARPLVLRALGDELDESIVALGTRVFVSENPSFRSSGGGRNWAEEELIGSGLPNMIVYARSMVRKYGS